VFTLAERDAHMSRATLPGMRRHVLLACGLLAGVAVGGCGNNMRITPPVILPEDRAPSWSPDSQWIAYVHFNPIVGDTTEPSGLYLTDAAGMTKRLLLPGSARSVDWSPDSRLLVFTDGFGLHIVTRSGDSLRTINPGGSFPSWSPDGSRIAFSAFNKIWFINPDGSGLVSLNLAVPGEARDPDWSPDGARLVILLAPPGTSGEEVYTVQPDGTGLVRLTTDAHEDRSPAWSPVGQLIAWNPKPHDARGGVNSDIAVMDTSGSGRRTLARLALTPAWDPDGRTIVFSSRAGGSFRLFVIGADGTGLRQLTR
jgi:Tol biopolymer transport system component